MNATSKPIWVVLFVIFGCLCCGIVATLAVGWYWGKAMGLRAWTGMVVLALASLAIFVLGHLGGPKP